MQPVPVVVHVEIWSLQSLSVVNVAGNLSHELASTQTGRAAFVFVSQ
jgi:hypothetical protein